jgi:hypothetical protein
MQLMKQCGRNATKSDVVMMRRISGSDESKSMIHPTNNRAANF